MTGRRLPPLLPLATMSALLLLAPAAPAQSSVRGFGQRVFDTAWAEATDFVAFAGGSTLSTALRNDGSVVTWGLNIGEVPSPPPGLVYQEVRAGRAHVLARRSDGQLVGWGYNSAGQTDVPALPAGVSYTVFAANLDLCAAARTDNAVVVFGDARVVTGVPPAPGPAWISLAASEFSVIGVRSDGTLVEWGGALTPARPTGNNFVAVAAGGQHAITLRTDGTVVAWGTNTFGETVVPLLPAGVTYVQIAAGGRSRTLPGGHCIALRSDGTVVAWGSNQFGQTDVPPLPPGTTYTQVAAGTTHSIVRRSDGRVLCFGDSAAGQCNAAPLPPGTEYLKVATIGQTTIALRTDGRLAGWGDASQGQLTFPPLPPGLGWTDVDCGQMHAVGLRSDGTVVAWGGNLYGEGNVPPLPAGVRYVEIDAGVGNHTVCRRSDGTVVAFGANHSGQCNVPGLPSGLTWVEVAAGFRHTLLRRSDGVLVAFGENQFGQCNVPARPAGLAWVEIAAGSSHSVARLSDGTAVGFGSVAEANVPPTPPGTGYVAIAASCARRSDGTAIGFGPNYYGQNDIPPLPPGQSWVQVDSGFYGNVARLGPASSYRRLAVGCAGTRPPARIVPSDTPRLGVTLRRRLFDLPVDIAFLVTGLRTTTSSFGPLPFSLAPLGAPGCSLFVSDDAVSLVTGSGNQAEGTLAIPDRPTLLGLAFHEQALVPDAAANALGAVMSDAMTAIIGRQ